MLPLRIHRRPHSLMDKVSVFGTDDVGSIPAGGTNINSQFTIFNFK